MKFELSKKTQSLLDQVTEFINKEIIPNESLYEQQVDCLLYTSPSPRD